MTHQVKGIVDSCTQRDQKTRNGMGTIHGCIVGGVEFETGFNKTFSEGEMIATAVKWDYGKWNMISGTGDNMPAATAGGMAKAAPAGGGGYQAKGRGKFPVDPKDGAISIIRQNSMGHAVKVLDNMLETGSIEAPKDKAEYLHELLSVALVITDFSSGQDIMQLQAAMKANKEMVNG